MAATTDEQLLHTLHRLLTCGFENLDKKERRLVRTLDVLELAHIRPPSILEIASSTLRLNSTACPICYQDVSERMTTRCGHGFCKCCLQRWLLSGKGCPMCRATVYLLPEKTDL